MKSLEIIPPNTTLFLSIPAEYDNKRIDKYLAEKFPSYSRTFFQRLMAEKLIALNGKREIKPSTTVKEGDDLAVTFPEIPTIEYKPLTDDVVLDAKIVFTHPHFFIVYKPANLIVHKTATLLQEPSLVDWLITHNADIIKVGHVERPGIVHRLDKQTSGLMIIPRNDPTHALFSAMFKDRMIQKTYLALVNGHPEQSGSIDLPIGKEKNHRTKMCHTETGRPSLTHYKVLQYYKEEMALVEVKPVTGRTHQIRVHFSTIGHPLVGDVIYGIKSKLIKRQALHARSLSFEYNGEFFSFSHELPADFLEAISKLTPVL